MQIMNNITRNFIIVKLYDKSKTKMLFIFLVSQSLLWPWFQKRNRNIRKTNNTSYLIIEFHHDDASNYFIHNQIFCSNKRIHYEDNFLSELFLAPLWIPPGESVPSLKFSFWENALFTLRLILDSFFLWSFLFWTYLHVDEI